MRTTSVLWLSILGTVVYVSGSGADPRGTTAVETTIASSKVELSDGDIVELKKEALTGSVPAARKLAMFYGTNKPERDKEIFWFTVCAENGDEECRLSVAMILANSQNSDDQLRARYWFDRITREGPRDLAQRAKFALENLEAVTKYRAQHKP